MTYPQIVDYQGAVQHPRLAFLDPDLQSGKVKETPLGLPMVWSGGFALTYQVKSGGRTYAVRCFHREVPAVEKKYAAISKKLKSITSEYFVDFDFQPLGIKIAGNSYPIVKMDWVEGNTLGVHIAKIASNKYALEKLRGSFRALAQFLESNGIAHGDIQNDNIIVDKNGILKLIDYDGMFVPGMSEQKGNEVGHRHFQHPKRGTADFGPHMDRFSFIVIEISLEALCEDPSLFKQFGEGGLAIVFKAGDYADPAKSAAINKIKSLSPRLSDSVGKLQALCTAPVASLPTLSDFLANRNMPDQPIYVRWATPRGTYFSAFPVLDASDFDSALTMVGRIVELVGKVVSVKEGVGKRGIGKAKPYVFVNFGNWLDDCVRLTIWSEGLSRLSVEPNHTWVGKWLSVTGLVEPPYDGKHFGKAYRSIGITISQDGEVQRIDENDALFRLGRRQQKAKLTNKEILTAIKAGASATSEPITLKSSSPSVTSPSQHGQGSYTGGTASAAKATHQGATQTGPGSSPSSSGFSTVRTSGSAPTGQTHSNSGQTTNGTKKNLTAVFLVYMVLLGLGVAMNSSAHRTPPPIALAPVPPHNESAVSDRYLTDNKDAMPSVMGDQSPRGSQPQYDTGLLPTTPESSSGTPPPYRSSQFQYGTGSLSTAAEQDELEETKPSFGQTEFSRANIRYCLFQQERLQALRGLSKDQAAIDEFNGAADNWNLYCSRGQDFVSYAPPHQAEALTSEPTISAVVAPTAQSQLVPGDSGASQQSQHRAEGPLCLSRHCREQDQMLEEESLQVQKKQEQAQKFNSIFSGTWAGNHDSCNQRSKKNSFLVRITSEKAISDYTSCKFLSMNESNNAFLLTAHCSTGADEWDANISLSRSGNKMTWSSERGTDIFIQCDRGHE